MRLKVMKITKGILLAILLSLLPLVPTASGAELKEVVAALEQSYNYLSDVRADFTQRTLIASIKREETGKGELFIKKGSGSSTMFRFDYVKPKQLIVSDGKTAWYYLPENRQVMMSNLESLFAGGNGIALNYLTGMGHISKDFTVSFAGEKTDKKGNYLLELVPRQPSQAIAKLRLAVSASVVENFVKGEKAAPEFPVVSSVVDDHGGNRTFIELSRVRVNQGISSSKFRFKVPKGVEVIKN
jgi:outer membrane lipoprotein carrier protein